MACFLKIDLNDIMPDLATGFIKNYLWLRLRKTYEYLANTFLKEFDVCNNITLNNI